MIENETKNKVFVYKLMISQLHHDGYNALALLMEQMLLSNKKVQPSDCLTQLLNVCKAVSFADKELILEEEGIMMTAEGELEGKEKRLSPDHSPPKKGTKSERQSPTSTTVLSAASLLSSTPLPPPAATNIPPPSSISAPVPSSTTRSPPSCNPHPIPTSNPPFLSSCNPLISPEFLSIDPITRTLQKELFSQNLSKDALSRILKKETLSPMGEGLFGNGTVLLGGGNPLNLPSPTLPSPTPFSTPLLQTSAPMRSLSTPMMPSTNRFNPTILTHPYNFPLGRHSSSLPFLPNLPGRVKSPDGSCTGDEKDAGGVLGRSLQDVMKAFANHSSPLHNSLANSWPGAMLNQMPAGTGRQHKMKHCPVCDKILVASSLYLHMKIHTGEKNYLCEFCCKRFLLKHHLHSHLKICQSRSIVMQNNDKKGDQPGQISQQQHTAGSDV